MDYRDFLKEYNLLLQSYKVLQTFLEFVTYIKADI